MTRFLKTSAALLLLLLATTSCRSNAGGGAAIGALAGAGIGTAIDGGHGWGGALVGAAIGAGLGYAVGDDIDDRQREARHQAALEAARRGRPVAYRVDDEQSGQSYRVDARPVAPVGNGPTRRVVTTVHQWDPVTGTWVVVDESSMTVN